MSLFNRKRKNKSLDEINAFTNKSIPLHLEVQLAQSLGITRNHMEDSIYALNIKTQLPKSHTTLGIFMVADGMGGHMYGDVASSVAIQSTAASLHKTLVGPLHDGQTELSDEAIATILEGALQTAHNTVLEKVKGGGTTLTVALVLNKKLYFAHVGDSRLYITSATKPLKALTLDHSLVQRLVELGQISQEDANDHPQRNVLFRALGQNEGFKADIGNIEITEPCTLLLCSDGLWGLVNQESLSKRINDGGSYEKMVNSLIEMANDAGGTDNISAILVKIS
ncbi:MAG: serine/threonine-protein phosphatase [Chloroflexi bacterium]|nr:serine/threonine-protein phosphatase [Chloroflexota bacterium]